jgi:serine/threonine protein kinase
MVDYVGQRLGNYRIRRLLGTGGFAEVYLGEHIRLNTEAAIKVLHVQLTDKEMEDFLNEARTIARLDHPNIVRVMEFDVQAGIPFLVMTYAPNGTLRQRHPRGQRLPLSTIVPYVKQVADALQYAHESKLIHRDIKPENMLLGRRNEILLSDFGIATIARTSRSDTGQDMAGTAAYMAPEQIQGHPRYASDQYSLGIVVYEWLGGDRPFHGSFIETCSQHLYAYPPPLHTKIPEISPGVEQVVLKALEKDAYQRFPGIRAFAEALEQASKSSTPRDDSTPPVTSQYRRQTQEQTTSWPALDTAGPTIPAPTVDTTSQRYPLPPQKRTGKRNILIASTILLVILIAGYLIISHPQPANLSCLSGTSTQRLLFGDCFQDNTNHWDLMSVQNQYSVMIANNTIILEDGNNMLLAEPIRGSTHPFTDFRLEVDADLSQGDQNNGYGVIIRGTLDTNGIFKTDYRFELFGNGQYAIYKGIQSGNGTFTDMKLVDFTTSSAIRKQGSINHISITAKGANMTLKVNGVVVHTITDNDYSTGSIALFVSNLSSAAVGAQATFSKLGIYQV